MSKRRGESTASPCTIDCSAILLFHCFREKQLKREQESKERREKREREELEKKERREKREAERKKREEERKKKQDEKLHLEQEQEMLKEEKLRRENQAKMKFRGYFGKISKPSVKMVGCNMVGNTFCASTLPLHCTE